MINSTPIFICENFQGTTHNIKYINYSTKIPKHHTRPYIYITTRSELFGDTTPLLQNSHGDLGFEFGSDEWVQLVKVGAQPEQPTTHSCQDEGHFDHLGVLTFDEPGENDSDDSPEAADHDERNCWRHFN